MSDKGCVAVYPMKKQSDFHQALHRFCKEVGVPEKLVMDAHPAQTSSATRRLCSQVGTIMKVLEQGTPWANRAELYIGLLKEATRKDLRASNAPLCLWDYCLERRVMIHNAVPSHSSRPTECPPTNVLMVCREISLLSALSTGMSGFTTVTVDDFQNLMRS